MRVVFAPTDPFDGKRKEEANRDGVYPTVTVEVPLDDMTLAEVFEQLVGPALKGMGYLAESVERGVEAAVAEVDKKIRK